MLKTLKNKYLTMSKTEKAVLLVATFGMLSIITVALSTLFSFGYAATLQFTIKTIANNLIKFVQGIGTIVGSACAAICALIMVFTKDQKASDAATTWLKRILIGVVIINIAKPLVNWAIGLINEPAAPDALQG